MKTELALGLHLHLHDAIGAERAHCETDTHSFEKNLSFEGAINLHFEALYRKKALSFRYLNLKLYLFNTLSPISLNKALTVYKMDSLSSKK